MNNYTVDEKHERIKKEIEKLQEELYGENDKNF